MQARNEGSPGTVWKLILSYDGTDFHGWQIQPGNQTIQGVLVDAIASVTGEEVLPQDQDDGCGRSRVGTGGEFFFAPPFRQKIFCGR